MKCYDLKNNLRGWPVLQILPVDNLSGLKIRVNLRKAKKLQ